jgi:hypothetical protein
MMPEGDKEEAISVSAAIDDGYATVEGLLAGPLSTDCGTPPRQMAFSEHSRRAAAHQAAACGDFSVQVSNARGSADSVAASAPNAGNAASFSEASEWKWDMHDEDATVDNGAEMQ